MFLGGQYKAKWGLLTIISGLLTVSSRFHLRFEVIEFNLLSSTYPKGLLSTISATYNSKMKTTLELGLRNSFTLLRDQGVLPGDPHPTAAREGYK